MLELDQLGLEMAVEMVAQEAAKELLLVQKVAEEAVLEVTLVMAEMAAMVVDPLVMLDLAAAAAAV
jgi:hypothetical protein